MLNRSFSDSHHLRRFVQTNPDVLLQLICIGKPPSVDMADFDIECDLAAATGATGSAIHCSMRSYCQSPARNSCASIRSTRLKTSATYRYYNWPHTVLTKAYIGCLARSLCHRMSADMDQQDSRLATYPTQAWYMSQLSRIGLSKVVTNSIPSQRGKSLQ